MLYHLKSGSTKQFETRRGIAYNAELCNKDGVVIGDIENKGDGGATTIWVEKEYRGQWNLDLKSKGFESHHEEILAEWLFDVEGGLVLPAPTEMPTYQQVTSMKSN
jgi:hypothetical protein